MTIQILRDTFVFICGFIIGGFLDVCIYQLQRKEGSVKTYFHCMKCGQKLKWSEPNPVVRFLLFGGRCKQCKEKRTLQPLLVELLNGVGYLWISITHGINLESVIYCLFTSVLLVISFLDAKTFEIPSSCNHIIGFLGVMHMIMDAEHWKSYLIGAVCVSGFLFLLYWITRGRGIGGGDIKLMATCGLLIGATKILVAFMLGCILAVVIQLIRMKVNNAGRQFAFGPYLCIGVWIAMLYGNEMMRWYLST